MKAPPDFAHPGEQKKSYRFAQSTNIILIWSSNTKLKHKHQNEIKRETRMNKIKTQLATQI